MAKFKTKLDVKIGKLKLKNPVMVASGTFGEEYGGLAQASFIGAVVTKTVTLNPRAGNPPPRIIETASGMLNSIGLENKGLGDFVANKLPGYIRLGAPVIISIAGEEPAEFGKIARELNGVKKIAALELNLSCPNIKYGSREGLIAQDEKATYAAVKAARKSTDMTIIAKLSPNVTKIVAIARAAESAGADAISLVNTFLGIAVDMNSRRPVLGNVTGGLSGPAIKPIALRMVREVYEKVDIPVIGMGGIMDYKDALEFILCGACAVQVGTANFVNPDTAFGIIKGIEKYMAGNKIQNIRQIIGKLGTA